MHQRFTDTAIDYLFKLLRKYKTAQAALHTLALLLLFQTLPAQNLYPYQDPKRPIPERVKDLVGRMTKEEKFWQLFMIPGELTNEHDPVFKNGLFGFQVSAASAENGATQQLLQYRTNENAALLAKKINHIQHYFIDKTRLGIPMIAFDEALHGLVRNGATVFPQSIGLAASWNIPLMKKVSGAIAKEAAIRGIRQVLSPVINLATDVRWGRTEETYGEDPYLTTEMGLAFVQPFEANNIITTPKHFIANVGNGGRDSYPIDLSEKALQESHYIPFRKLIKEGGSRSIMTSYNSVNGSPATANDHLLNKVLKKDWQFKGFVISDASAVGGANVLHYTAPDYPTAGKQAITNGLDVIFQTAPEHHQLFIPPFLDGTIQQARIDDAVARVLTAKFQLGLFESPYVDEQMAGDTSFLNAHQQLAREAAAQGMVLLKNKHDILPIHPSTKTIALIGTDATEARLGGYSGPGNHKVSILEGLQNTFTNTKILYAAGTGRYAKQFVTVPDSVLFTNTNSPKLAGLHADYYQGIAPKGKPLVTRIDPAIDFHWTISGPHPLLQNDFYSVNWNGFLRAPVSGKYQLGLEGNDGYRLYLNNQLIVDQWEKQSYHTTLADVVLEKGKYYALNIEFKETVGNAHIKLIWNVGVADTHKQKIKEAVAIAQQADVVVITAGIEEGEFRDRASLALSGYQEAMIKAISGTGKPVIVVLVGGSAITMQHWIEDVAGILTVWYPGEQGGNALADVLSGNYNPAGRLPITWPLNEAQLPLVYNHLPTGRGDDYNNLSGLPLFPFGYGLSYTSFAYDSIRFSKESMSTTDSVMVTCRITNTGKRDGSEVVQLYVRDLLSSVARPVMSLKAFQRIALKAGASTEVSFSITPETLEMVNTNGETVVEPGDFSIMIGASSRDIRLKKLIRVTN